MDSSLSPDDAPAPDGKKKLSNISGRVPAEVAKSFYDLAEEIGSNGNRVVIALAEWFLKHKRLPTDADAETPPRLPHPKVFEHLIRRELAAAVVLICRLLGPHGAPAVLDAVRRFYLSGSLHNEVTQ